MEFPFRKPDDHPQRLAALATLCATPATAGRSPKARPSGLADLDAALPGGGWPRGAITELMPASPGIGELALLLPALSASSQTGESLAWITPPLLPCAAGLSMRGIALDRLFLVAARDEREMLWAAEQALRCQAMGAVLLWPKTLLDRCARRLQRAAEAGGTSGFVFRPAAAAATPSPAALRLCLHPRHEGIEVRIIKARGGRPHALVVHPAAADPS